MRLSAGLRAHAARKGKNACDAAELAQEVITRCLRSKLDRDRSVDAYAYAVLDNLIKRERRSRGRAVPLDEDALSFGRIEEDDRVGRRFPVLSQDGALVSIDDRELLDLLERRLALLPERIRTVCHAHWFEDASYKEIASRFGIHETTARVRCSLGRKLLSRDPVVIRAAR